MKRLSISLDDLAARGNLLRATWKAARGKQHRPSVAHWLAGLDDKLADLATRIREGRAPVGGLRRFRIQDPKPREISVHGFADRVLHHAIFNLAEARLERSLVDSSFACRPGKGVHAAVQSVQQHLQRHAWCVQVDVASYFAQIDHALLMDLLSRRFKGDGFLALLQRIVESGAEPGAGRGLPIGALTSRHFANAYLDAADRWLLEHPVVRGHVRYMDDIVWWCDGPAEARQLLADFTDQLWHTRRLRLNPNAHSGPCDRGLRFCGFRVKPGVVLASARKLSRFRQAARVLQRFKDSAPGGGAPWDEGGDSAIQQQCLLQRAHDNLLATVAHTQTLHFRQRLWARLQSSA
ncbi:MAG: group II intron reverse transcriptase domain-containing protein [Rubrivivax sp.]|nr:group II intron reverse transcriptase domain-containing protein [Rubrivivax sp.]